MNLRLKILLSLIAVFATYVAIDYTIHHKVVFPRFEKLERAEATKDLLRCHQTIARDLMHFDRVLRNWVKDEDFLEFIVSPNDTFRHDSLGGTFHLETHLNFVAVVDPTGVVLYQDIQAEDEKSNIKLNDFPTDQWSSLCPLHFAISPEKHRKAESIQGLIATELGPMQVISRPVHDIKKGDTRLATIVVGRFLDSSYIQSIVEHTGVDFSIERLKREASHQIKPSLMDSVAIIEVDAKYLLAKSYLKDLFGTPIAQTQVRVFRGITQEGRVAMHYAIGSLVVSALVVLLMSLVLLQRIVISPLNQLSDHATKIARTRDLTARLEMPQSDEFGDLSANIDMMVYQLGALFTSNEQLHDEIDQRKQAESQLQHAATHDSLTQLPNRNHLKSILAQRFAQKPAVDGALDALIFLDLDNFKIINDSLGHAIGDELLIQIGRRLQDSLQTVAQESIASHLNMVARLGGDEFVIFLAGLSSEEATKKFAEQIRRDLCRRYTIAGHELTIGTSLGIAFTNEAMTNPEELMRNADLAMYRAKFSGKQCLAVFDHAMHESVLKRLELEEGLRTVLKDGGLRLVYQPIFDVRTGTVKGLESLVRWDHATKGLINPVDFIPVAEEIGLIVPIGRWILEEACRTIHKLNSTRKNQLPISVGVNVSKRQLADPDFVNVLKEVLETEHVPASQLNLEITESMIMDSPEQIVDCLSEIRSLGVRIHMDDFGTGHSSLSCLHRFPIDVLKIDRSFVSTMEVGDDYESIIHAIITLAHNLDTKVIAEGIETPRQLQQLRDLECDFGQGYLYSKPKPIEELADLLSGVGPVPINNAKFGFMPQVEYML